MELLDILKVVAVTAVLIPACVSDWRRREASDVHWAVIGIFGILCMFYASYAEGMTHWHIMMIIGVVMILLDILYDFERRRIFDMLFYAVMAALFIIPVVYAWDDVLIRQFLVVPAAFLIFLGMFVTGLVRGGADVKCLIVLAMVFQTYPVFSVFPLIGIPDGPVALVFQFSLMVMFHAALFSAAAALYYLARNLRRGERGMPYILLGYRMDIADARNAHVWPMQTVSDGVSVRVRKAQEPSVLDELEGIGEKDVWVTPMVPFLIPIAAAVLFVSLIGNLLFLLPL